VGVSGGGRADSKVYAQPPPPPPQASTPSAAPAPAASTGYADSSRTATVAAPSKAPAPAKVATKTSVAKDEPAQKQEAKPIDSTLLAWAKSEHARAIALAQKGECTAAAKVASGVSSRANDYYAQYMATDRSLKQCQQYIAAEREKEAAAKAKAAKARATSEPAGTTLSK
jgi:hypothetical protein